MEDYEFIVELDLRISIKFWVFFLLYNFGIVSGINLMVVGFCIVFGVLGVYSFIVCKFIEEEIEFFKVVSYIFVVVIDC